MIVFKKPTKEKTIQINLRVTVTEARIIKAKAKAYTEDGNVSHYIRRVCVNYVPPKSKE